MWHFRGNANDNIGQTKEIPTMKKELLEGLTEEQIAEIKEPKCGSNIIVEDCVGKKDYYCNSCGHEFNDNLWEDIKNFVN